MSLLAGKSRTGRIKVAVIFVTLMLPVSAARAADLWEVTVTPTDGSPMPDLTVGGSSLPDLLDDLINAQGQFSSFDGVTFSANVSFGGVTDAINVTVDPTNNTGTLTFTVLGPGATTFTFTGTNLSDQIDQFIRDNLADQLSAFLNSINRLSLIAVTDGAPLSTTALSAKYVFERFGLHADLTAAERRDADAQDFRAGLRVRFDGYYEHISTDVGNGNSVAIAPSLEFAISRQVSVALLIPIAYHEIEGADILNVHGHLAVPVTIISPDEFNPWGLRITPFGTLAGSGSVDMVAGGLFGGGGLLGTVTLAVDPLRVSFSSQLSFHESITLRVEDFEFDPGVSQQIFKNGLKATYTIGDNFYLYGSVVYSMFLQDAAVDDYWTPGVGLGYRTIDGFNFSVGYSGDIADGYRSDELRMTFQMPF